MKSRLTIRQRLVRSLSKRIKVARVIRPGYDRWHIELDSECLASGRRDAMREARQELIPYYATKLQREASVLRRHGFKITFPS